MYYEISVKVRGYDQPYDYTAHHYDDYAGKCFCIIIVEENGAECSYLIPWDRIEGVKIKEIIETSDS